MDMSMARLKKKLKEDKEIALEKRKKNEQLNKINVMKKQQLKKKNTKDMAKSMDRLKQKLKEDKQKALTKRKNAEQLKKKLKRKNAAQRLSIVVKRKKKDTLSIKSLEAKRKANRDRQRKRRAKMSLKELEKKRAYDRQYKAQRKKQGTWKLISAGNMTEREKRIRRKQGKIRSRRFRLKCSNIQNMPVTPSNDDNSSLTDQPSTSGSSRRKIKNRNRSKVYLSLKRTQEQLELALKLADKYKKRINRLRKKKTPSPRTKINILAGGRKVPTPIKRRLIFTESIISHLAQKRIEIKGNQKKQQEFARLVSAKILKKYKIIMDAKNLVTYKMYKRGSQSIPRKPSNRKVPSHIINSIQKFYEEDANSKMMPGKKDWKTNCKEKVQKRILLDSLKNLLKKYNNTHTIKCSYSTFIRQKPFWIVSPKINERNTCACIKCTNIKLLQESAYKENIVKTSSTHELIKLMVCDINNKSCMFGTCSQCKEKVKFTTNDNKLMTHKEWISKKEERIIKNKIVIINTVKKIDVQCTLEDLVKTFEKDLLPFKQHIYKVNHQYAEMKKVKEMLKLNEVLLHIDFSENYVTKYFEEIQAMHFGASKKQLSLHTGIIYLKDTVQSFCTISDNIQHGTHAIWAHLHPILNEIQNKYPLVDTLHFQSDGPCSQYKNRSNLYLLVNFLPSIYPNVKKVSWNFSIAGHGKGAMDGVGGVLKRTADTLIARGCDITTTSSFVELVGPECKSVNLIEIPPEKIEAMKEILPAHILPIPGVSQLHQITWSKIQPKTLYLRELSCFTCDPMSVCIHHALRKGVIHFISENHVIESNEANIKSCKVNVGNWVVVEFTTKKTLKHYIGIVENACEEEGDFIVKFMRRKSADSLNFIFPTPEDRSVVSLIEIKKVLNQPIIEDGKFIYSKMI